MTMEENRYGDDRDVGEKQRDQHIAPPGQLNQGKVQSHPGWPGLPFAVNDSAFGQVVRSQLNDHPVSA